jgi:hypothetical protein
MNENEKLSKLKRDLLNSYLFYYLNVDEENLFYIDYKKELVIKRSEKFSIIDELQINRWLENYVKSKEFCESYTIDKNKISIILK